MPAGPTDSLVDVSGLRVGHHQRVGPGWLTGTTVVVAPPGGAVAGVDVRGGGPGTRETDALDPRNLVERIDAVVLSGGSAFGLAAADGVMRRLAELGRGFPVLDGAAVVPVVPAAVIFDLGRGGDPALTPDASFGAAAFDAAHDGPVEQGAVGAGTGARAGGLRGGVGSASEVLAGGATVAALVVVNSFGRVVDVPGGGEAGTAYAGSTLNTTIGVVATDLTLTKAQCQKLAGVAHDGLARAIDPAHTMLDGDTFFALATGTGAAPGLAGLQELLTVAPALVRVAIERGVALANRTD